MNEYETTYNALIARNCPVLFLDTCSLLDVMRDPTRKEIDKIVISTSFEFLNRTAENPPSLSIGIARQVLRELNDHVSQIEEQTKQAVERFNKDASRILELFSSLGLTMSVLDLDLTSHDYHKKSRAIVDRYVGESIFLLEDSSASVRAGNRVINGRPPSSRGKSEYKDCLVIETYLCFAQGLRNVGFSNSIFFLSSNVSDYTEGPARNLHSELRDDFSKVKMEFAMNFGLAAHLL